MRLIDAITSLGGLLVPIIAIIVGGAIAITAMIIRHQERIAKIERGIDPDAPPRSYVNEENVRCLPSATLRAVRWVGWLVTVISGFMLTLLTNGSRVGCLCMFLLFGVRNIACWIDSGG